MFSEGDEDEDDEGISERSIKRSPSDDGKYSFDVLLFLLEKKHISF